MAESLLDREFLERLEYLYVITRELFVGHSSAERISAQAKSAPSRARARATARPMPWAAPVTSATRPARSPGPLAGKRAVISVGARPSPASGRNRA